MSEKKYYWLKLKKDFFKRHDIQIIEAMPNGKDYILFYLKMLVESVDHDGSLRFSDTIPYNENMLATITNTNVDVVKSAMKVFTELHMIDLLEDKTIYMLEVEKMLGTETYWAEQKRKQREPQKLIGQCPQDVQEVSNVSNQEIDIDKDKELDKELDIDKDLEKKIIIPYSEIVNYLNLKANTKYRASGSKTKDLIKARFNEGMTLDDFKIVIDKKSKEWIGTPQEMYLRPETLFGAKFEGYLNQKINNGIPFQNKSKNQWVDNCEQRETDFEELEKKLLGWTND